MSKHQPASKSVSKSSPNRGKAAKTRKSSVQPWMIALGVIVVIAAAAFALTQRSAPTATGQPAEVSVQQAREMVQNGAFLLDVRTQEEWNDAHVEGAKLIPLDQLEGRVNDVPKDQDVVIICRSGNRSAQARDLLRGYGFTQVTSVAGGINEWRSAGFPTVSGP